MLKKIFNLAIEPRGYLVSGGNPFEKLKPRKRTEKPKKILSIKESRSLINVVNDIWWKALLSMAYTAALRRGEILNLTWSDVDFENCQIHVAPKEESMDTLGWEPKDHECRVIPLPDGAVQLLVDLQAKAAEGCPDVFVRYGGGRTSNR